MIPKALDFSRFHEPEEQTLHARGHLANLVEEDCPAVGRCQQAL
jgi:hypothetical protein